LETLDLSSNKINDSTLSFLEGLSSLKHLYLNNNQLKGSIDMKGKAHTNISYQKHQNLDNNLLKGSRDSTRNVRHTHILFFGML